MNVRWFRVSKQEKCVICNHPDWCTWSPDISMACCMRVESGKTAKNGGNLHSLGDATKLRPLPVKQPKPVTINAAAMMKTFERGTHPDAVEDHARQLGVTGAALALLGAAWSPGHRAWAFPMRDWSGAVVGIRLRDPETGRKWAVTGSHAGLFYAECESVSRTAYICEGPTDTAAALSIGLDAIGRPSCMGSEIDTDRLLERKKCRRAVIVCDDDGPGFNGATKLSQALSIPCALWVPMAKDIRKYVNDGGTAELIESTTRSLVWLQPNQRAA